MDIEREKITTKIFFCDNGGIKNKANSAQLSWNWGWAWLFFLFYELKSLRCCSCVVTRALEQPPSLPACRKDNTFYSSKAGILSRHLITKIMFDTDMRMLRSSPNDHFRTWCPWSQLNSLSCCLAMLDCLRSYWRRVETFKSPSSVVKLCLGNFNATLMLY